MPGLDPGICRRREMAGSSPAMTRVGAGASPAAAQGSPRLTEWLTDNGLLLGLALLDGLAYAALVFLVAVGLNLVFGVLRIVNVAHGSLFAIGAYTAASIGLFLAARGLPPVTSYAALLLAAVLVGAVLGPPIELLVLRWVYGHEESLQLLVTFALFMILEDVQKLVWGVQPI